MSRFDRAELVRRFHDKAARGEPIIGGGAGTGLSAKCEEAGGIVTLTVMSIVLTGVLGNMAGESILRLARIHHPVAKGLALGTSAHAVGTAKALELGEIEGAMSSLSIAVAGLMTVIVVPLAANLIK